MIHLPPLDRQWPQRAIEHLQVLGAVAEAALLAELIRRIDGFSAMLAAPGEHGVGGHRFPPRPWSNGVLEGGAGRRHTGAAE